LSYVNYTGSRKETQSVLCFKGTSTAAAFSSQGLEKVMLKQKTASSAAHFQQKSRRIVLHRVLLEKQHKGHRAGFPLPCDLAYGTSNL
jgi:hypothetical protein